MNILNINNKSINTNTISPPILITVKHILLLNLFVIFIFMILITF